MRVSLLCATAILMAISTTPSMAVTGENSEDVGLLTTGRDLIRNGDYRTALIQLKKAVRANPSNPEARFELGRLQFRTGDYLAAEKELIQARENGFAPAKVSPLLASTYLAEGRFQQLLDNVTPCPTDPVCKADVLALRARAHLSLRNLDDADRESSAALEADPMGEASRTTRAIVLMVRNDNAGAERIIDTVLVSNPKNSEALAVKGDLRRQAHDLYPAIRSYRSALEITPNDTRIRQSLAMALMASDHDDEARAEINQVLDRTPKAPMALYLKAVLLVRAKKIPEALDTVRPAESMISQIPQGAFLLALIHSRSNNLEQALDYAAKFHAADPDSLLGDKLLANINLRMHAYSKVISILSPVRDRLSDDGEALEMLGSAYLAEGRIKEANDLLTEALRVQPTNSTARAHLAISRTSQGATRDEGIRELEGLIISDPKNRQVDLALIYTYIGGGEYDKAIAAATTMAQSQPESPMPFTLRGAAKLAKGDDLAARSDFETALAKNPNYVPAAVYLAELDMQAGRFDPARKLLDDILKRSPTDMPALQARARIESRANKPAAAVPYLESAIRANPAEVDPRIQLMRAEAALGDKVKLSNAAMDLARSHSTDPAAVDLAARTLFSVGKNEEGLNLYRQLQATFPLSPQLHERYGQALTLVGQQDDARTAFDRAISTDPHYMSAWISRIALEQKMKGMDAAMAVAEKAKLSNPDNPAALILPGDLLLASGKTNDAEVAYRKAFEQKPSSITTLRLFHAMTRKGDRAGADALLTGWIKDNPNDVDVRTTLAAHKSLQGDYRTAATQYEAVAERLPRNATILNNLAWTYGHLGDARAVPVAKRAYSMSPDTPAFMDTYGCLLYRGGDQPLGRELVRRAYDASPRDPQVGYHMAVLLVDSNDPKGARTILKSIVESKASFDGADEARKLYSDLSGS